MRAAKKVSDDGPAGADVLIVGEAPGLNEERQGLPFVGASGKELTAMLHEAGFIRTECYITNVCKYRPPENNIDKFFITKTEAGKRGVLERMGKYPLDPIVEGLIELDNLIDRLRPKLIIAFGNTALWALTGEWGITSWRGSYLYHDTRLQVAPSIPVLPTYHPAAILRQWSWRSTAVHDLRRARQILDKGVPQSSYWFTIAPSFEQVMDHLDLLEARIVQGQVLVSVDLETRHRQIACLGLGYSATEAICIPFMSVERPEGYWTLEEEFEIVKRLRYLLPLCKIIGQNFLYDIQYLIRQWALDLEVYFDTMIAQGVCYPGQPKGLDYISSMYCRYHRYWKDESKNWDPKVGERQLWEYNAKDCVTTWEGHIELKKVIRHMGLEEQFQFEMDLYKPILAMVLRGTRLDLECRNKMLIELMDAAAEREQYLSKMFEGVKLVKSKNAKPWYRSPIQQRKLFYEELKIPPIYNRKTKKPTVDDKALDEIAKREPLLYPIIDRLQELRSIGVISSTFVQMALDHDSRARCSYNPVGTETLRFNSYEDSFGYGTNMQNIPRD